MLEEERVRRLVAEAADLHGLDLVDLQYIRHGRRWRVRVFVDRRGGVTVGECARLSRALSRVLDSDEVVPHSYVLEVSSPGVHRALASKTDFARVEGRTVRLRMDDDDVIVGAVASVSEGTLHLLLPDGNERAVELDRIEHGALEVSLKRHRA